MAAYAAVVSLQHTINALLSSSLPHVSSIREILEYANKEASSLLQALEALNGSNRSRSSMERVDALEALIRDSAHKLEDVLEFHELKQLEEEEEKEEDGDEEGVMRQEIRSFGEAAKRLEKEYLAELSREDNPDDDEDVAYTDFGVEMIGFSRLFKTILKQDVLFRMRPDDRYIYSFLGEDGSGFREVVKNIFENAREAQKFERWGWVRVGKGCKVKHVLMYLIAQVKRDVDGESLVGATTDDRLSEYLYKALENRSYMIVLDGVEDVELLRYLRLNSFPDQSNGSAVLVTTSSRKVALSSETCHHFQIPGIHAEDYWLLIRRALFGWKSITPELELAGKEIVHNTEDDVDDDDCSDEDTTHIDFGMEMIGRSDLFNTILKQDVLFRMRPDDRYIYPFLGEEGSGSRIVVKTIFQYASNAGKFECSGWARVGGKGYEVLKHVQTSLIAQIEEDVDDDSLVDATEDQLSEYLYKALDNRSYMIVLDGVEDAELLDYLCNKSFPDQSNGSLVLVTTTSMEVALSGNVWRNFVLNETHEEDTWLLVRYELFGWESIPPELDVAGREIVHNTGLRALSLAKTIVFLAESDKTVEQWSELAADKGHPIFTVADEISEIGELRRELRYYRTRVGQLALGFVHFPSQTERAYSRIYPERYFSRTQIIAFFGMAGIGKTNFARNIFKDDSTLNHFDHRVWIHIGPRYQTKEILLDILAQIYLDIPKLLMKEDKNLLGDLCAQVSNERCLIVLDDLYSQDPLHHLRETFPEIKGTILVTTRLPKVAEFEGDDTTVEMQLLDEEQSWCLLCKKVFDGGECPPELEKAGRKIAEKCDGLPLLILTVADQLSKVEQSEEYWNSVASGKEKSIFRKTHHQISKALLPSYHNLPQHLKPCFLHLGIFLERYHIPISSLSNLWISEGFLKPNLSQMEEDFVVECLSELIDRSLVMVQRVLSDSPITVCRLHSVFWHLSNSQGAKSKFFHAMNIFDDCSMESIESQRRLCIRENILLSMKDVHESIASNTSVHSFLCVGPLHQYPVPLNFDLRLMRVMNALQIRLYEFPTEVTSLFHLRYLSLTCNGELPSSISKLHKLQCLIVKRYMTIKSSKNSSYLPSEIWDMKELKHLQVMGGCLPNHRHGSGLLKLSTLLDVSAECCREEVLKWIPNLKRLGIRIEVVPTDENNNSFPNLNDIYHLDMLESFKCVVVNPHFGSKSVLPHALLSMFPPNLKRLSLSGLGYSWEHMSTIGKLKNLEVLKLKCYAFQGPKWEMDSTNQFEKLKIILMDDLNLVNWKLMGNTPMNVEHVCIRHCYKLQEFPSSLDMGGNIKKIEIMDGASSLVTKVEEMGVTAKNCEVNIHCSWLVDARRS